jgi:hypothetical protein
MVKIDLKGPEDHRLHKVFFDDGSHAFCMAREAKFATEIMEQQTNKKVASINIVTISVILTQLDKATIIAISDQNTAGSIEL